MPIVNSLGWKPGLRLTRTPHEPVERRQQPGLNGAAADAPEPTLVVSVHDVSPLTQPAVDQILLDLARCGVVRTSLLVIPDHHGRAPLDRDPNFKRWLSRQVEAGHEVVLHGYRHLRERRRWEGPRTRITTRLYTADEGEFFDLDGAAAGDLLARGVKTLAFLGTRPTGFIAPAWLLSEAAERAARDAGFLYTTRIQEVKRLVDNQVWASQSLVYSTRARWRRWGSLWWNGVLFNRVCREPLLRIGVHPPDIRFPGIWNQLRNCCKRGLETHACATYGGWVSSHASP